MFTVEAPRCHALCLEESNLAKSLLLWFELLRMFLLDQTIKYETSPQERIVSTVSNEAKCCRQQSYRDSLSASFFNDNCYEISRKLVAGTFPPQVWDQTINNKGGGWSCLWTSEMSVRKDSMTFKFRKRPGGRSL